MFQELVVADCAGFKNAAKALDDFSDSFLDLWRVGVVCRQFFATTTNNMSMTSKVNLSQMTKRTKKNIKSSTYRRTAFQKEERDNEKYLDPERSLPA